VPVFESNILPEYEQISATQVVLTLSANAIVTSNGPIENYAVYIEVADASGKFYC